NPFLNDKWEIHRSLNRFGTDGTISWIAWRRLRDRGYLGCVGRRCKRSPDYYVPLWGYQPGFEEVTGQNGMARNYAAARTITISNVTAHAPMKLRPDATDNLSQVCA